MSHGWVSELRQVARMLVRSRGFTTVAVLSLAIGIGANTVMYTVARYALLDPLSVAAPHELRIVQWTAPSVLAAIGLAIGIPASLAAGPLVGSLLFGVGPRDPAVIAVAALVMLVVALAAGALPARRAARLDPMVALRTD